MMPILISLAGLMLVLVVRAEPPNSAAEKKKDASPAPEASLDAVTRTQDANLREYKQFEELILRMALRMERSGRPEDKAKAESLRKAIDLANKQSVENRFSKLLATLTGKENAQHLTTDELERAAGQNEELVKILREMLDLLLTDSEILRKREEARKLTEMIKQVEGLIRQEKVIQAKTDGNKIDTHTIGKDQKNTTQATESLARQMGAKKDDPKPGDPKKGDPNAKPGDPKPGDAKPGDSKPGDSKPGSPKPGDSKPSDSNQQQPQNNQDPQQQPMPGQKQIQDAIEGQKKTEDELAKDKREPASKKLDEVIDNLEKLKKELEKRLKQLREEELERLLANLQSRCERMLAMQIEVYEGTKRLYAVVQTYPDKKPTRPEEQRSQQLSTKEGEIVKEANKTMQLLESEGSAVAFAMTLESVRDDMMMIEKRLDKYDSGTMTQRMEEDVIAALKDMIEALKKAQKELQDKKNDPKPPPPGQPPPQRLLDLLAELKLIKTLQVQVNKRTKDYGAQYEGEQADDKLVQDELTNLSKRQGKIEQMTKDIATGKNR
jgi:hypothetical protein